MKVRICYKVYEFNRVMGNTSYLALQEVIFEGYVDKEEEDWQSIHNHFETEEEAIETLIKFKKNYEDFVILKTVYIN